MEQHTRRLTSIVRALPLAGFFLVAACTASSTNSTPPASGGQRVSTGGTVVSTGGVPQTGGFTTTGGEVRTGGVSTGGVSPATGGIATGGVRATGGSSTGGVASTGGTATGGLPATGGIATGGVLATGGVSSTGGADAGTPDTGTACPVPKALQWSSTGPIISNTGDATHTLAAVKDPTVVRYNNLWHVFGSIVTTAGAYNMFYTSFADWTAAPSAKLVFLDQTPGLNGYTAAPQVFYSTTQKKWFLIYQSGPPKYSTNTDIANPKGWTAPASFYSSEPSILKNGWLDFWVICDAQNCHMFFSDDHGLLFKSKTTLANFPSGFGTPVIVMQEAEAGRLYEAANVYKLEGTDTYLLLVEAYDSTSNFRRYFRSWTAQSLDGPWTVLHDDANAPFAGAKNVTFDGTAWTNDISHGDAVRSGHDETMKLDPCKLQYLYQGFDPKADTTNYNAIPWRIGLLTAK